MAAMIDPEKSSLPRAAPRLLHILRVLARHKFLSALLGKKHWPPPKEVRETFEELGLAFLKFGQVIAMRRDLLPAAYIDRVEAAARSRRNNRHAEGFLFSMALTTLMIC